MIAIGIIDLEMDISYITLAIAVGVIDLETDPRVASPYCLQLVLPIWKWIQMLLPPRNCSWRYRYGNGYKTLFSLVIVVGVIHVARD